MHLARGTAAVAAVRGGAGGGAGRERGEVRLHDPDPDDAKVVVTRRAGAINSRLRPTPERGDPKPLKENEGLSFQGSIVLGMGFVLTHEERAEWVRRDPRNGERIFPYIGGEEVNTNPDQGFDRWVINFGQMELSEAERWPDLLGIVREKVKPERDALNDNADGQRRKAYWWQFGRYTPAMFEAIRGLPRCLVTARVTKHLCFSFQPTDRIPAESLNVVAAAAFTTFAVLQSRIHEAWARLLSSSMKTDLRYSVADCFATFPFPGPTSSACLIETQGEDLYRARVEQMKATNRGLTATYNALRDPENHDPAIADLRRMHEDLDRAVLDAYGWQDIAIPPYAVARDRAGRERLETFENEVIDRLFALNAARSEAQR